MSKMSKAIAALGVVAGLGVAALPLSTYAAIPSGDNIYKTSTSAQVEVIVEGAISIATDLTSGEVVTLGKIMPGGITDEMKDADALKVTVSSNSDGANFNLYINGLENNGTKAIMKGASTGSSIEAGVPAANTSAWGYAYSTTPFTGEAKQTYAAIPMTAEKVNGDTKLSTSGAVEGSQKATNDSYFKFQASASNTQLADTYTGTVVFTAVVE